MTEAIRKASEAYREHVSKCDVCRALPNILCPGGRQLAADLGRAQGEMILASIAQPGRTQ